MLDKRHATLELTSNQFFPAVPRVSTIIASVYSLGPGGPWGPGGPGGSGGPGGLGYLGEPAVHYNGRKKTFEFQKHHHVLRLPVAMSNKTMFNKI